MKIENRSIDSIYPYEKNPRINEGAIFAVQESIRIFGFRQPIVVDNNNIIIVGHTRYKAALNLGLKEVPVHIADNLTEDQVRAYRIIDNSTNTLSNWDFPILKEEIDKLETSLPDLKIEEFGLKIFDSSLSDQEINSFFEDPNKESHKNITMIKCPKCGEKFEK